MQIRVPPSVIYFSLGFAAMLTSVNASAKGGSYLFKAHFGLALSGKISLDQSSNFYDYPLFLTAERFQKFGKKLMNFDQAWSVGVSAQYSAASYEAGGVIRRGSHQLFGVRGGWRLSRGSFVLQSNLELIPFGMLTVYSSVDSMVNGERINSTSQTELYGYGFRLGFSGDYQFSYKLFSGKHNFVVGASFALLKESFNKRRDLVVQTSLATGRRDVSDNVRACSCGLQQLELSLQLGYQL